VTKTFKVLDFGLAKDVHAGGQDGHTVTSYGSTQPGMVMGTPLYMSPEQ
jgi:serine/threonine protein kinase